MGLPTRFTETGTPWQQMGLALRKRVIPGVGYTDEDEEKLTILDTSQKPVTWTLDEMQQKWYWSIAKPDLVKTFLDKYENSGRWMLRRADGCSSCSICCGRI